MNRRKFVAGAGGIGAATIGGIAFFGGSATAEVSDYEFNGATIQGESDDGSVDDVRTTVSNIVFRYEGLEDPADEATVKLQVVYDGDAETIDEATTSAIGGTSKTGAELGEELGGSILEHSDLEAADFEADEDGDEVTNDVTLRLEVTVTTEASDSVSGSSDANLKVIMENIESDAAVGGEADGEVLADTEHIGTSPENPDANPDTEGVLSVYGQNAGDEFIVTVELEEPWSDEEEEHANLGLGFDVDSDGLWDFQVNWSAEDDFFSDGEIDDSDFDGEKDGETITFTVDAELFDGDSFDFVANASYGGPTHANVSTDPAESWSEEDDWRSSEYFVNVELSEE